MTIGSGTKYNICLILVWLGPWPEYYPYFLESCILNPKITWKIFSNNETGTGSYEHVQHVYLERDRLEIMVKQKTGLEASLADPYKICDLKPAFGELFSEYLDGFDYWGYCDMDVLWGNVMKFISGYLLEGLDVLSCYPGFLSGPLTIYRNSATVNSLYRECPSYREILQKKECQGFDENIRRQEISGWSLRKAALFCRFLIEGRWREGWARDARYHYQWYVKRMTVRGSGPADMTEVVTKASAEGRIRVEFLPLLWSEPYFNRIGQRKWKFMLDGDELFNALTGREVMGFHFQNSKSEPVFRIQSGDPGGKTFLIDETGLRYE